MSARLLKKVLKEQESLGRTEEEFDVGRYSESLDSSTHASLNPFDLLSDDDYDKDQMTASEIAAEPLVGKSDKKEPFLVKATENTVPSSNNKRKKKKKSKEDPPGPPNIEKPFDVILENLSVKDNVSSHLLGPLKAKPANVEVCGNLLKQCITSILQVEPKYLRAENELRRIFGSKVVNSFKKSHQTGSSGHIRGVRRGSHNHRRTVLVSPSEHWPRWDGSLLMEFLETRDGYHYFKYVHSSLYRQAHRAFEAAKAIHDQNGIASILAHHPYHLDSLLNMAVYFSFSGEHEMSADCIAKCLYALECAWHPMFIPLQGNCQLKYSHETNRPLFDALFAHMKNMDRRGCHRSALEICKLLLLLDSDDPKGAMFYIDYLSLRAEEYAWLEHFSDEYRRDNSLWLFPNFSFSLAVCRFYLELEVSSKDPDMELGKATATDLLKQALMLHPPVLKKLVAKVPLKDETWRNILLHHSYFGSDEIGIPSLDHLINIYVERNYVIWRLPDLQKLLEKSALLIETQQLSTSDALDWACVRKEAFPSEKNEYSHLLVSDFSDSVPTMPPDDLQNFLFDPRMREEEVQNGNQVANPRAPRDVANRNALVVLFESMLPWNDYGVVRDGVGDDDDEQNHNGQREQ